MPKKLPEEEILNVKNKEVLEGLEDAITQITKSFAHFKTTLTAAIAYLMAREIETHLREGVEDMFGEHKVKIDALSTITKHHEKQIMALEHNAKTEGEATQLAIPTGEEIEAMFGPIIEARIEGLRQRLDNIEEAVTQPPTEQPPRLEPGRIRASPVTKVPRHEAEARVRDWWADGGWHTPDSMARKHASGQAHFRYLRGNLSTICRDFYRDGHMQRKDSNTRGSMYTYRLTPQPNPHPPTKGLS